MRIDKRFCYYAVSATVVIFLTAQIILAGPRNGGARGGARPAAAGARPSAGGPAGHNFKGARPGGQLSPPSVRPSGGAARPNGGNFSHPRNPGQTPSNQRVQEFLNTKQAPQALGERSGQRDLGSHRQERQDARQQNHDQRHQNRQQTREQLSQYAADNQPFTPQWYREHPQAWEVTHPHADAWAVASFARAANWLGWVAVAPVAYEYSTVYETASTAPSDPVQVETAGDLVHQGDLDPSVDSGEWLPLGVFALLPAERNHADHLVQLAINKDGAVSGSYYDVLSDTKQPLYGSIDPQTQRVAWTVGSGDGVIFETSLSSLTEEQSGVLLHFGNGQTQKWTLYRQAGPESTR